MKKFAVAYLSVFEGELNIEFVDAASQLEAAVSFLNTIMTGINETFTSMEEVYEFVFNMDGYIEAREIPN